MEDVKIMRRTVPRHTFKAVGAGETLRLAEDPRRIMLVFQEVSATPAFAMPELLTNLASGGYILNGGGVQSQPMKFNLLYDGTIVTDRWSFTGGAAGISLMISEVLLLEGYNAGTNL